MGRCVHEADEKWGGESKGADEKWGGESVTPACDTPHAFGAVNSECDFPNNCSLSLPFVRCIPEINTKAAILSILICLFFLLFIIMLAFISISLPLILINIGHLYD